MGLIQFRIPHSEFRIATMLGLPTSTEIRKVITKKKVYEHFGADMSAERRKSFDGDIGRITLVNEVSPISVNIAAGDDVQSFFVILIALRRKEYDRQNIAFIAKMFGQKLLLVLEYEEMQQLAVWETRLIIHNAECIMHNSELPTIKLQGLDLDAVWANIVAELAGIELRQGQTLNDQLVRQQKREKLLKEITKVEKQAWAEKQPKRKMELAQRMRALQSELEAL